MFKKIANVCRRSFLPLIGLISLSATPSLAAPASYPLSFALGWNLAGNSLTTPIDVKAVFGAQPNIATVWKWEAKVATWAFYSPSFDSLGTLADYLTAKGYQPLPSINQGEGFWVNALAPVSLSTQNGTGFPLASANLSTNWNLVATADDISPGVFADQIGNITTLWAWDNATSSWYFYSPSMVINNTYTSYLSSKGFHDFGTQTLGQGRGFWVNYAGAGSEGTTGNSTCLVDGSTSQYPNAKVCYTSLPMPFSCDAAGMKNSAAAYLSLVNTSTSAYTYSTPSTCPTGVPAGLNSALKTVTGPGVVSTIAGTEISSSTWAGPQTDGEATSARFYFATSSTENGSGLTSDGTNLYVVDSGHCSIRSVDIATGFVSTLAGTPAGVEYPYGFPCGGHQDGIGTSGVYFMSPTGITIDPSQEYLYVSDGKYVRKIAIATGQVSTIVGPNFTNAQTKKTDWFKGARGITTDGTNLYLIDQQLPGTPTIVRVINLSSNEVTNLTNLSGVALVSKVQAITFVDGNLYVAGGSIIYKIDLATQTVTQLAGDTNVAAISRDGVGTAATFTLNNEGIVSNGTELYVSDGSLIRKVVLSTGVVSTFAGGSSGFADGSGDNVQFNKLGGLTIVNGVLYATDNYSAIRQIK